MPHAIVVLDTTGAVVRTHSYIGGGQPTNNPGDLERLLVEDYKPVREQPINGGVLLVLEKP